MNNSSLTSELPHKNWNESTIMIRLTALWALNEAGLGGLLHLFRTPFSGIVLGGFAVLIISLIAKFSQYPSKAIFKALLVVLVIKGVVSPHSPLPAYFAVSFQGIMGMLLFKIIPSFRLAAFSLGILALVQSSLQKLIVLTVLFGRSLWDSISLFIDYVLQKFDLLGVNATANGSMWLVVLYVSIYLLFGVLIGWLAGKLPKEIEQAVKRLRQPELEFSDTSVEKVIRKRKPFWKKTIFKWIAFTLIALMGIYLFLPAVRAHLKPLWLLVRVLAIIVLWYFIVAPLLLKALQRIVKKKATEYQKDVSEALSLLPVFKNYAIIAWNETKGLKRFARWKELVIRIIGYSLIHEEQHET